jgi:hypothetical protein
MRGNAKVQILPPPHHRLKYSILKGIFNTNMLESMFPKDQKTALTFNILYKISISISLGILQNRIIIIIK